MRVIDLLNKIANGEEVPKKFIYVDKENVRYIFDIEEDKDYWCEELGDWFFNNFSIQTILNDELEIIEDKPILVFDEKDKVVEVNIRPNLTYKFSADGLTITSVEEPKEIEEEKEIEELVYKSWSSFSDDVQEVYNKVNELIKVLNELKKGK